MKKLKKSLVYPVIFIGLIIAVTTTVAQSHTQKKPPEEQQEAQYTCPMHPEVVQDKPGKCPKCGMDLVMKENKSKEMMHSKGDTARMQCGHTMGDSASMHQKHMMKDSTMMQPEHKMK